MAAIAEKTRPTGTTMPWWNTTMAGFDLETTGPDAFSDRIVTAAIVIDDGQGGRKTTELLLNPGIDIPEGASAVHGISTEHSRANGMDYVAGVTQIVEMLTELDDAGIPLVAFNGSFDFTMLHHEAQRLGLAGFTPSRVIDPLVMDRIINPNVRGKGARKLGAVAKRYGVELIDAHNATADVIAAIEVARAMLDRAPTPQDVDQFHATQKRARDIQQIELQRNLRKWTNDASIECNLGWPIMRPGPAPSR